MMRIEHFGFPQKTLCMFVLLFVVAITGCKSGPSYSRKKQSVILITLDTTRADRLGVYGNTAGLTPFLDEYSKKCTVFNRCDADVPLTLPSHTSIMSGYLPIHHGVRVNVEMAVPDSVPLLASDFKRAGYETGAFVSSSVLLKRYGLNRGFDLYDQSFYNSLKRGHQKAIAKDTLSKALIWLRARKGPYFCWIHLYDPHVPYEPPEPFGSRYKKDPYDGEIAYMDSQLGAFWKSLSASVDTNKLLTVICGDHGESLGEHGELDHGIFLYQSTMHVPFMIHEPGQREGRKINTRTGLIDVAPTIREETGLTAVAAVDGQSLVPLMKGKEVRKRAFLLESMNGLMTYGWAPLYGLLEGNFKYIRAPRPELYNLAEDPLEEHNLISSMPGKADELKLTMSNMMESIKTEEAESPKNMASKEELKQLASLGYLGGTFSSDTVSNRDPKDYIFLVKPIIEANILVAGGEEKKAQVLLKDIAEKDPDNPFILFLQGQAYQRTNSDKAMDFWKRAIKLDRTYQMAWTELVVTLMNEGRNDEAAKVAEQGLESCSDRLGVLHLAIAEQAFIEEKETPQAVLGRIGEVLELNPDLGRAYMLRGLVYFKSGRPKQARAYLTEVWNHSTLEEVNRWKNDKALKLAFDMQEKALQKKR